MARGFGATFGAGSTDVVTTGLTAIGQDKRSLSFWCYVNGTGGGAIGRLLSKQGTGATSADAEYVRINTLTQLIYFRANTSGTKTADHVFNLSPSGAWHHVLVAHDQSSG